MKNVEEMVSKRDQLNEAREAMIEKLNEINDKANAEKRDLSEEEQKEYNRLEREVKQNAREVQNLNVNIESEKTQAPKREVSKSEQMREWFREARKNKDMEYTLQRRGSALSTAIKYSGISTGGIVPLTIEDILPPLESGLIYDKVGLRVATGVAGDLQWSAIDAVEAAIVGETVDVDDSVINFTKIPVKHVRLSLAVPVSNQAINDAYTDLAALVAGQIHKGLVRTINRAMFSHENFTADFHGPWAATAAASTFAGSVPTFAELMGMAATVKGAGVDESAACFVMSSAMFYTLKATPKATAQGMIIGDDNRLGGFPVYVTEFVNYGAAKTKDSVEHIAFGVFSYLALNQHGAIRLTVDPYTGSKRDVTYININADFSMTTLRSQAFTCNKAHA